MLEGKIEVDAMFRKCGIILDGWRLDEEERRAVQFCGITIEEPGGAVAIETRARYIIDVDRHVDAVVDDPRLVPVWLRLAQPALEGMSPLEAMAAHVTGLRLIRTLLQREGLQRGFA